MKKLIPNPNLNYLPFYVLYDTKTKEFFVNKYSHLYQMFNFRKTFEIKNLLVGEAEKAEPKRFKLYSGEKIFLQATVEPNLTVSKVELKHEMVCCKSGDCSNVFEDGWRNYPNLIEIKPDPKEGIQLDRKQTKFFVLIAEAIDPNVMTQDEYASINAPEYIDEGNNIFKFVQYLTTNLVLNYYCSQDGNDTTPIVYAVPLQGGSYLEGIKYNANEDSGSLTC